MGRSHHGRARGNGRRVNQICHFGVMGGLAPLQGVPLAHRSFIMKHATTKITIPPGCEAGRRWMLGQNPYQKYLLSKNPVGSGRVDVITKTRRKCNCGPRPRGDGSQVGTHIFAELTPSAYPYGHGHSHTHPHGYPPHHHPHPYNPDGLCLTWRWSAAYQCEPPSTCPLLDVGGAEGMIRGDPVTKLQFSEVISGPGMPVTLLVSSAPTTVVHMTITDLRVLSICPPCTIYMVSGVDAHESTHAITVIGMLTIDTAGQPQIQRPFYRFDSNRVIKEHGVTNCWDWYSGVAAATRVPLTSGPHGDACGVASEQTCA